jgi:O-antigen/teichoic acid export membrane protein
MVAGAAASRVIGLLSSIILARLLGKIPFGEFGTIQSTVGLFGTFAGLGIGITATKYVAELRDSDRPRCGRMLGFSIGAGLVGGLVAGAALILTAGWLARYTLAAPHLAPLLRAAAPLVSFGALQGAYLGALSGFEAFKQVAWINWIGSILGLPIIIGAAYAFGLEGAVYGTALPLVIGCVFAHFELMREAAKAGVSLSFTPNFREFGVVWRFTLPAFLSTTIATPAGWLARTFLLRQPDGYAEIALVSAANQWLNFVTFLPWMMSGVLIPIFSNLYSAGRRDEFRRVLSYNLLLNGGVALALALPLVLLARWILGFYGPAFQGGVLIFYWSMVIAVFNAFNGLLSRAMQSAGRAWIDMFSSTVWAVVVLIISWLLVERYKGAGFVAAQAGAALAWAFWQWVFLQRMLLRAGKQQ